MQTFRPARALESRLDSPRALLPDLVFNVTKIKGEGLIVPVARPGESVPEASVCER